MFKFLDKYKDLGLLIIRIGLGLMFIFIHGWPKLSGGAPKWEQMGGAMKHFGITFAPVFWGFMDAFAEFFGGISLLLGVFFRPMMILLTINMFVAFYGGIGGPWSGIQYPFEIFTVILAMFILGPGKYSIDGMFRK